MKPVQIKYIATTLIIASVFVSSCVTKDDIDDYVFPPSSNPDVLFMEETSPMLVKLGSSKILAKDSAGFQTFTKIRYETEKYIELFAGKQAGPYLWLKNKEPDIYKEMTAEDIVLALFPTNQNIADNWEIRLKKGETEDNSNPEAVTPHNLTILKTELDETKVKVWLKYLTAGDSPDTLYAVIPVRLRIAD